MREIKFRIWDDKHSRFNYQDFSVKDNMFHIGSGGQSNMGNPVYSKPMQQYTGLKDKNGKEVYEGDIVLQQMPWTHPESQRHSTVEYIGCCFYMVNPEEKTGGKAYYVVNESCEVIGNIYENPELLPSVSAKGEGES